MSDQTCQWQNCERDPRMAVSVDRPNRGNLKMTTYFDDRSAPARAQRFCKQHGIEFQAESCTVLVEGDNN